MILENLFSYGTLQQEKVQIETFGRKLEGEKDTLVGYCISEIEIKDEAVIEASGKNIHPIVRWTGNNSDEVEGTVFEITKEELYQSDKYEVEEYQRVAAELKSGKTTWIYAALKA